MTKHGFPFVEGEAAPGQYYRISRQGDQIVRELNVQPKARYVSFKEHRSPAKGVTGTAYLLRDLSTGELIGEDVNYGFNGGWAERFLAGFSDAGPGPMFPIDCDVKRSSWTRLEQQVFNLGE